MIKQAGYWFCVVVLVLSGSVVMGQGKRVYGSKVLEVDRLSKRVYVHRSYLYNEWGKVDCNGVIYVENGKALVFDTPVNDMAAMELLDWLAREHGAGVEAVVVTHFHGDCLGSLGVFHARGIVSYSHVLTQELAGGDGKEVPQRGFEGSLVLKLGERAVVNTHFGEGHTRDNIVSYLPDEGVLFGGCLVKAMGAGKGYLGDANVGAWSETVGKVRVAYPGVKWVVPGHGDVGGGELLEYTEGMFGGE